MLSSSVIEEAEAEESLLRDILDALPDPALIVVSGRVMMSNGPARDLLGPHIEGGDVRLALRHPAALERLLLNDAEDDEVELVGVGGAERRWMMAVRSLSDGSKFVRLSNRSEAYAAEQMRVDFVANASHELRTPLATILGYAETLREQGDVIDPATRERFTGIIHDEARRMQRLVEDLISLSRIEAERFSAPSDAVSLPALIEDAKRNCHNSARDRDCEVVVDVPDRLPAVAGDHSQLLQLIENLVSNAIRYGRRGRPIHVTAVPEGNMVHLSVRDEGEGIPAQHIPRLTERFYRLDTSRSRAQGGTGLGLSIVKHIVERHRGRLTIESRMGVGTTVHVLLPVADGVSQ